MSVMNESYRRAVETRQAMTANYQRSMTVACPTCLRPAGQPCVYVHPSDLTGAITQNAHNTRAQRSMRRLRKITINARRNQLRAWLQAHGDIFQVGAP